MLKFTLEILLLLYFTLGHGGFTHRETEDPNFFESKCPKYWVDATEENLGCLLFNSTSPMTWIDAQNFCSARNDSHLVEIFSQKAQDFITAEALALELASGNIASWWIGLTDLSSRGRWYWSHSLIVAEFTSWIVGQPQNSYGENYAAMNSGWGSFNWHDCYHGDYHANEYVYPLCQFFPKEKM